MGMTKQQRDYAVGQVKQLRNSVIYDIEQKHPIPPTKELSKQDQISMVRTGKVKMFPANKIQDIYGRLHLSDVFDFSPIKDALRKAEKIIKDKAKKAISTEAAPFRKEAARIIDQIMLGDSAEALKLIAGFAKMCT